jgi:hypothetical protein
LIITLFLVFFFSGDELTGFGALLISCALVSNFQFNMSLLGFHFLCVLPIARRQCCMHTTGNWFQTKNFEADEGPPQASSAQLSRNSWLLSYSCHSTIIQACESCNNILEKSSKIWILVEPRRPYLQEMTT